MACRTRQISSESTQRPGGNGVRCQFDACAGMPAEGAFNGSEPKDRVCSRFHGHLEYAALHIAIARLSGRTLTTARQPTDMTLQVVVEMMGRAILKRGRCLSPHNFSKPPPRWPAPSRLLLPILACSEQQHHWSTSPGQRLTVTTNEPEESLITPSTARESHHRQKTGCDRLIRPPASGAPCMRLRGLGG